MFVDGVSNRDCIGLGRRDELVGVHRLLAWVVLVSPRCVCWVSWDLRICKATVFRLSVSSSGE